MMNQLLFLNYQNTIFNSEKCISFLKLYYTSFNTQYAQSEKFSNTIISRIINLSIKFERTVEINSYLRPSKLNFKTCRVDTLAS